MEPRSHSISTSMEICGGEGEGEESRDGDEGTAFHSSGGVAGQGCGDAPEGHSGVAGQESELSWEAQVRCMYIYEHILYMFTIYGYIYLFN